MWHYEYFPTVEHFQDLIHHLRNIFVDAFIIILGVLVIVLLVLIILAMIKALHE